MASATASLNTTTNTVNITYDLAGTSSAYLCWSDTETTDHSTLISNGNYTTIYGSSGTWTETAAPPAAGSSRYYYFVDQYGYTVITSCGYTGAPTFTITDFTAEVVTGGVLCQFTAPAGISNNRTIQWQRTTTNPETGTPVWTTVETTDLSGTTVTI